MILAQRLLPERDCTDCPAKMRVRWGCEQNAVIPMLFDGEETLRCPLRPRLEDPDFFNKAIEAWNWKKQGFLMNSGTWQDQPGRYVQAMSVIDKALDDAEQTQKTRDDAKRQQDTATAARSTRGNTAHTTRRRFH